MADADGKFLHVSTKGHGSMHDSRVLKKTLAYKFQNWRPFEGAVLLADSAYAASDWVIPMKSEVQDDFLGNSTSNSPSQFPVLDPTPKPGSASNNSTGCGKTG